MPRRARSESRGRGSHAVANARELATRSWAAYCGGEEPLHWQRQALWRRSRHLPSTERRAERPRLAAAGFASQLLHLASPSQQGGGNGQCQSPGG